MAWTTAVLAFVLVLPLWRFSCHAISLAHEGGHALIGLLTGGKLLKHGIHLNTAGGGATHMDISGIGRFLMLLAGYLGPSVVGFAGAQMLVHDFEPQTVLIVSLVAVGTVLMLWFTVTRGGPDVQRGVAYVWVWFMLMGSTRKVPDLYYSMLRPDEVSDAEHLQTSTHISDVVWLFVFWLGTIAALLYGGALLLRDGDLV